MYEDDICRDSNYPNWAIVLDDVGKVIYSRLFCIKQDD
jgi:hypothetical protein